MPNLFRFHEAPAPPAGAGSCFGGFVAAGGEGGAAANSFRRIAAARGLGISVACGGVAVASGDTADEAADGAQRRLQQSHLASAAAADACCGRCERGSRRRHSAAAAID